MNEKNRVVMIWDTDSRDGISCIYPKQLIKNYIDLSLFLYDV